METAHYLGIGLAGIVTALSPARILVGGEITGAWDLMEDVIAERIRERTLTAAAAATPVTAVPQGGTAAPARRHGAAGGAQVRRAQGGVRPGEYRWSDSPSDVRAPECRESGRASCGPPARANKFAASTSQSPPSWTRRLGYLRRSTHLRVRNRGVFLQPARGLISSAGVTKPRLLPSEVRCLPEGAHIRNL